MKYFALLTKLGENLIAQATALGTKIELTHMAVGDGGGSLPTPDTNQTKLIAEKRRAAINTLFIDEKNKNQIIAEQIIPESEGGWWIREIGLFDKAGNLIAVANCPETYKPQLAEGSGRTQSIRIVLIVSHTESVTLKIDPSVVLATREYVNTEITVIDKKIDALSAQTKLDLNKKFDKANISGQKGNDNDKVPSLHLFTTEIGKLAVIGYSYSKIESDGRYQPKGNYAPAGDYATNVALNNGLGLKFDKTSIVQSTGTSTTLVMSQDAATKSFLKKGEFGFGGFGADRSFTETEILAFIKDRATVSQIFRNSNVTTSISYRFSPIIYSKSANTWAAFTADIFGAGVKVSAGDDGQANTYTLWTNKNAVNDRNGYLRTASMVEEIQSVPVGGTVIWNGEWDANSQLAEFFWPNEGRSFSATTHPLLAKIFPNLKLPDDRGYAIRVADNGKGIDIGRKVGTYQEDQIQNITGSIGFVKGIEGATATGAFSTDVKSIESSGHAGTYFGQGGSYNFDASRDVRAGSETRMKNVAKILITRVK
ncbi:phage tail protein [Providencia huaxiensis]|uniref:phage tail protein n=1 Tax=Providencia huaxiensis TaxID=2027290 RepID=UPI001E55D462|nr:phage tail protein [Providencia huaxiensis]MCD2528801.1 phage tail protein [Providencia huaxiensis]